MTDKQPEALIRADELEAIGAESSLARTMAAHTIRLLYKENEALRAALAQPEQEPVGTVYDAYDTTGIEWNCKDAPAIGTLLYTAPPQRDFIGLTDKERDEICLGDEAIARAIEQALREKNNG